MSAPAAFGPYRVLHQTGSGVQGPVFRAFDSKRDRLVAVKAFQFDLAPAQVVRAGNALRQLAANPLPPVPELVPVLDAGIEGTLPFIVTECLTGDTLDTLIRRLAPMPLDRALPILRGVADGLDQAADAGTPHGALHPRDVFVSADDTVRITGFGIAQALAAAGIPPPARRPYTRAAAAPDDAGASDRYAVGVIAHEMLTGARPSQGEQDGQLHADTTPEQRVRIRRALARALSPAPGESFARAGDFVEALAAAAHVSRAMRVDSDDMAVEAETEAGAGGEAGANVDVDDQGHHAHGEDAPAGETTPPMASDRADTPARDLPAATARHPAPMGLDPDVMRTPAAAARAHAPARRHGAALAIGRTAAVAIASIACGSVLAYVAYSARHPRAAAPPPAAMATVPAGTDVTLAKSEPAPPAAAEPAAVAPPPAPSAVEPAPTTTLVVRSEPSGALVTIDGRRGGETPATIRELPAGVHVVRIARPGHVPHETRVLVEPGGARRTIDVTLAPALAPGVSRFGAVDVDSRPRGARVRVDGRLVGTAPLRVSGLDPGVHEVALELDGYLPASRRVALASGPASALAVTLRSLGR